MARNKYDIDERLITPFNLGHIKRAFKYVKPHAKKMILALFLSMMATILGLFGPLITKTVADDYIPNKNIDGIIWISMALLATIAVSILLNTIRGFIMARVGQDIIHQIRSDLFEHLQELPFTYFDSRPHGKILVRVINYVNNVSDFLSNGLVNIVLEFINIVYIFIFMLFVDVKLTFIVLSGLFPLAAFILSIRTANRKAWQLQSNKMSNLNAYTHESITGMRITQAFVREEFNFSIYSRLVFEAQRLWMHAVRILFSLFVVVENIAQWVYCLVCISGVYWFEGVVTAGTIMAMGGLAWRFWQPIQNIANLYNSLVNTMAYLERIFELLDEPVTIADKPGAYDLPPITGEVEFKNVSFSYDEGVKVLDNVSFKVKPGESVALVGPTGSGKTTIVNLLSRFYDIDEGEILIDGHSISDVTLNSLRRQMGVMLQDSFIFSGTIADNIRYGRLEADQSEIEAAAKVVKAHEFIAEMGDRYETEVNERGGRLSAGQKQLISFARTLLSDPKILILDEATSSIDAQTEKLLQEGLKRLLQGRTSFIIAHRLSTIRNCSKIMFIQNGRIAEAGTHEELLAKRGLYYRLYTSQLE